MIIESNRKDYLNKANFQQKMNRIFKRSGQFSLFYFFCFFGSCLFQVNFSLLLNSFFVLFIVVDFTIIRYYFKINNKKK